MREIKFRAWDDNRMVNQTGADNEGVAGFFAYIRDDAKVMQFTGLMDKNGKEIYEGDILYNPDYSMVSGSDRMPEKRIVTWHEDEAIFKLGFADQDVKNGGEWPSGYIFCKKNCIKLFEVVGNIYQNSDLLNPDLL